MTAHERYQKLMRVFGRLMKDFNRDDLDDFILTANSLREWIRRDQTLTVFAREVIASYIHVDCKGKLCSVKSDYRSRY
jgi:hypothetical protein